MLRAASGGGEGQRGEKWGGGERTVDVAEMVCSERRWVHWSPCGWHWEDRERGWQASQAEVALVLFTRPRSARLGDRPCPSVSMHVCVSRLNFTCSSFTIFCIQHGTFLLLSHLRRIKKWRRKLYRIIVSKIVLLLFICLKPSAFKTCFSKTLNIRYAWLFQQASIRCELGDVGDACCHVTWNISSLLLFGSTMDSLWCFLSVSRGVVNVLLLVTEFLSDEFLHHWVLFHNVPRVASV